MRILLSTIGSRGDVQPIVALALALRSFGHEARLCIPPDFKGWVEGLGFAVTTVGPELRATGLARPTAPLPTPEQRRAMVAGTVDIQFETIMAAARGCDLIVGATALQVAAPSVAEHLGVPYAFAAYCPAVLPSRHHAPPVLAMLGDKVPAKTADFSPLWMQDAQRWNDGWREPLNARRTTLGLAPVEDVRGHVLTSHPLLAADAMLAPWPEASDAAVVQTGAWILPDERPLAGALLEFLDAGEPPVYFGFGSLRAPQDLARTMISAARSVGRRAIVSRGWAGLALVDDAPDCLSIDEVNQQLLFQRVAAVVHHGGAGTTTAAARAGAPQVVIPQHYDQHYWAQRVGQLGIGTAHSPGTPTPGTLAVALEASLRPEVSTRARALAAQVRGDGAFVAARFLASGAPPA